MTKALYYPGADRSTQWAFDRYPGDVMNTNTLVLHTTETTSWPSYSTGYFPTLTYHPGQRKWRQHLPMNRSARALENAAGGVETNTANCAQIELVGSCDPSYHKRYGGVLWSDPPASAIEDLAAFIAWMHAEWGLKFEAPAKWPSYPTSYANGGGQRMTGTQWHNFYGTCGHMHVPENHHGDPGALPIAKVLDRAKVLAGVAPATPSTPTKPQTPEVPEPMANPAQLVQVDGDAAVYAVTLSGAVHVKNKTHLDLLRKSGQVTDAIEPVTKAQLADLLEVE